MDYRLLESGYDAAFAELVRSNLKAHHLDIPGTVYFDDGLDHISDFYSYPSRSYYVLLRDGEIIGGIGLAEFNGFADCCELQKLYLRDKDLAQAEEIINQLVAEGWTLQQIISPND